MVDPRPNRLCPPGIASDEPRRLMATLSDLPDLVLLEILSLLPVRERVRNARVCRRWKRLARDPWMWRHADLPLQEVRPKVVRHVLRHYIRSSLQSLHLHGYRVSHTTLLDMFPEFFKALGKKCPRLQCLSIHMANLALVPMSSLPRTLRRLEMHSCDISHLWMQCKTDKGALPLLEQLVLDHVPTFRSHHLCLLRRLPALRSLVLCGTYSLTEEELDRGLMELSQLQRIEVLGSRISTDSVLQVISCRLRNVRHIRVTVRVLTATGLEALEGIPTLESLSLLATWDTRELCVVPFAALLSSCLTLPRLRVLELQGWEEHEAEAMLKKGLPHCRVIVEAALSQTTDWWRFVSNPINSNKFPSGQLSSTIVRNHHGREGLLADKEALSHTEHLVLDLVPTFQDNQIWCLRSLLDLCPFLLARTYLLTSEAQVWGLLELSHLQRIYMLGCIISSDSASGIRPHLHDMRHIRVTIEGLSDYGLAPYRCTTTLVPIPFTFSCAMRFAFFTLPVCYLGRCVQVASLRLEIGL